MASPKTITVSHDPKGIVIEWDDGHKGTYPFPFLRKACPCAMCKGERIPLDLGPLVLPVLPQISPDVFQAKDLFKIGNYAIGFQWGDGHNSGIYTFDYLRKMCPCEECTK